MQKKVLQIIGGLNRGGAETMLMNIFRNIDKKKYQFDFLVYSKEEVVQDYDAEIKELNGKILHVSTKNVLFMFLQIFKICRDGNYDVIHTHTLFNSCFGIFAGYLCKIPIRITHSHSTGQMKKMNIIMKIYMTVSKKIIKRYSTHFFACGVESGNYLFGKDFFQKNGKIFKNGIDLSIFYPNYKKDLINKKDRIQVGCIGSFYKVKNHKFIICMAEWMKKNNIRNVCFNLIGKGNLELDIKKMIKDKKLEEYFVFWGTITNVHEMMHNLDVLVMPSLYEGIPVTLIEAQACGLPCIISNKISNEVDLQCGLIHFLGINDVDYPKWNDYIQKLKKSHYGLEKKAEIYSKLTKEGYNIKETAKMLERIYESGSNE